MTNKIQEKPIDVPAVEYIEDKDIDSKTDYQLRHLLCTSFTGQQHWVFAQHRYFSIPYPRRWVMRNKKGQLIAQVGLHDKTLTINGTTLKAGGVGDVCVHPDYRGRGYIRIILKTVHNWMQENEYSFSILWGKVSVYQSSGYTNIDNIYKNGEDDCEPEKIEGTMVKQISTKEWPKESKVLMRGNTI